MTSSRAGSRATVCVRAESLAGAGNRAGYRAAVCVRAESLAGAGNRAGYRAGASNSTAAGRITPRTLLSSFIISVLRVKISI